MNAEYIRTMPLNELLPFIKTELKANKLWRDEYDDTSSSPPYEGGVAVSASFAETDGVVLSRLEIGSREWYEKTINLIRQRFFTLKDFSKQGRAYFSEDYDFDPAAIEKNLSKFPDLKTWLPELADRFEAEFVSGSPPYEGGVAEGRGGSLPYTEEHIETVVKAFTEEKGTKLGVIMNGARTLLTGVAVGPSMLSVFEIIGLDRTLLRLRSGLAWEG